jgi:hypothetical protein
MKWLLAIVVIGLIALGVTMTTEAPWTLVCGWAPFLARVLPRITVNAQTATVGAAAFVIFTAGVHWLGRSAYDPADGRRWQIRWSLAAVATVVVLFAAGVCLIGLVHQTGWLLAADESNIVQTEKPRWSLDSTENSLKTIAFGVINEFGAYGGSAPVGGGTSREGETLHGWVVPALPYTYAGYMTNEIDLKRRWNDPLNQKYFKCVLGEFTNPRLKAAPVRDSDGYGLNHYAANCRAMANGNFRPLNELTNGTSTRLLIGEVNANFEPWGKPGNCRDPLRGINKSSYGFGGPLGAGGVYFANADGSVRFISDNISPDVLKALASPDH